MYRPRRGFRKPDEDSYFSSRTLLEHRARESRVTYMPDGTYAQLQASIILADYDIDDDKHSDFFFELAHILSLPATKIKEQTGWAGDPEATRHQVIEGYMERVAPRYQDKADLTTPPSSVPSKTPTKCGGEDSDSEDSLDLEKPASTHTLGESRPSSSKGNKPTLLASVPEEIKDQRSSSSKNIPPPTGKRSEATMEHPPDRPHARSLVEAPIGSVGGDAPSTDGGEVSHATSRLTKRPADYGDVMVMPSATRRRLDEDGDEDVAVRVNAEGGDDDDPCTPPADKPDKPRPARRRLPASWNLDEDESSPSTQERAGERRRDKIEGKPDEPCTGQKTLRWKVPKKMGEGASVGAVISQKGDTEKRATPKAEDEDDVICLGSRTRGGIKIDDGAALLLPDGELGQYISRFERMSRAEREAVRTEAELQSAAIFFVLTQKGELSRRQG